MGRPRGSSDRDGGGPGRALTAEKKRQEEGGTLTGDARPKGPDDLFRRLDELAIAHRTVRHVAVFTVEEARRLRGRFQGSHSKNLFLRDKKERHWLVSVESERKVDLAWLAGKLGTGRLTFCSARRLMGFLGIRAGSVSPFAVINDHQGAVRVALDRALFQTEPLHFHPLDNTRTTSISGAELIRFLEEEGHPPLVLNFP